MNVGRTVGEKENGEKERRKKSRVLEFAGVHGHGDEIIHQLEAR